MASIREEAGGWRVFIRRKGFKSQSKQFKRKSDAEKWARAEEAKMDAGIHVAVSKDTLRTVVERFIDEVCDTRNGGRWERLRLNAFLQQATFVDKPIGRVTPQDIDGWIADRLKVVKSDTALREAGLLSGVYTHAIKQWRIPVPQHPVRMANKPRKSKGRTRRVTEQEQQLVRSTMDAEQPLSSNWYTCCMFLLAVETGLRLSEISRLQAEHLHLDQSWLHVVKSKNGDSRDVPLTKKAILLLQHSAIAGADKPFPVNTGTIGTTWRRLFKQLGFEGLHFHDSRHEACSQLSKFYTVLELAKIIGHRDLRSLMIYYNPTPQELALKLHAPVPPTPQRRPRPKAASSVVT